MLYFDAATEFSSVTVYRDYNEKDRFYYLPKSPRLSHEAGEPMFQLLIYRDIDPAAAESMGGGFLAMTTDLGIPPATLERVRNEISSRFGVQANLVPVPIKSGTVRIVALDSGRTEGDGAAEPRFVEDLVASGTPSLYGEQRAVFTAELSKKGAVLMRAALEGAGATPIVAIYDLRFVGLLPAYDVKITIKFQQAYQHFRSRAQMNTLWFRSDIDREMESLRKSGAIKIEEVTYRTETPEQTAGRIERLNNLAKELAQWTFFKPGLNPGSVLAADRGTLEAYDSAGDLTRITAGLTSISRAAVTGVGATEDVGAPRRPGAGVATDALEGGDAPAPRPAPAEPAPGQNAGPETAVEAWNRAGRPQGAFLIRDLQQEERQEIVYELHQVTAVEQSIAPQGQIRLIEGAANLRGRIVEVDLRADFFKTIGGTIATSADLGALGISSAVVKLRYGTRDDGTKWKDDAEIVLSAAGQSGQYRFAVDRLRTRDVEYQVVLNYKPDSAIGHNISKEESAWRPMPTRSLDLNPLEFSSVLPVQLQAALVDWETVRQVQARIRYQDGDSGLDAADTKVLTREAPVASVLVRPKIAANRKVSVDSAFFYTDGGSENMTLAQPGDEPFIINQPPASTVMVDVRLADILSRYTRVTVQLARPGSGTGQVLRSVNLTPGATEAQWSFRREAPGGDGTYLYRVTAFLSDGSMREEDWATTDNPLLVVGDRAAGVLTVRVLFLGTLADAGFRLAKLELTYPDAPSWADPKTEQIFRTGAEEFTWRVPMSRTDATSYNYVVNWFANDGSRKTTGPVKTSDEILLLDPLAP